MDISLFDEESQELLEKLEQALLELAENPTDVAMVDEAFRQLHTIKGNASLFGFDRVIRFTHLVEYLMDEGRNGRVFGAPDIDLFLACLDTVRALVEDALGRGGDPGAIAREPALTARLHEELNHAATPAAPEPHDIEVAAGVFLFDEREDVEEIVPGVFLFDDEEPTEEAPPTPSTAPATPGPPSSSSKKPPTGSAARRTMRVPSASLDRLMDLIGALVTAGARTRIVAQEGSKSELLEALDAQDRLLDGLREAALALRMVPIGDSFNSFKRLVREVSGSLDKKVRLQLEGTDTEIDKTVVEQIKDPLMHLVRNALDHGVEMPDQRVDSGKPAEATLTLRAYQEFGTIVIEVQDDGAGINRARVLEKALSRGLAPPDMTPDDPRVPELIMMPGFSTKDQVSDLSGRGVGMDVVATAVRSLRGTLTIDSEEGRGTLFRVRLPLTLAIISGFLIEVGEGSFVVPMDKVIECVALPKDRDPADSLTSLVERRGEMVPFIRMDRLLGHRSERGGRGDLVLVRSGSRVVGLLVDKLVGAHQTVVKPIGPVFQNQPVFSGASLLGSGQVALILDTDAIIQATLPAHAGAVA